MQACTADADCAVVEIGCCDHCNGGKVISVAKAHAAAATAKYKETNCSGTCTERGCLPAVAVCVSRRCGYRAEWMIDQATGSAKVVTDPLP